MPEAPGRREKAHDSRAPEVHAPARRAHAVVVHPGHVRVGPALASPMSYLVPPNADSADYSLYAARLGEKCEAWLKRHPEQAVALDQSVRIDLALPARLRDSRVATLLVREMTYERIRRMKEWPDFETWLKEPRYSRDTVED